MLFLANTPYGQHSFSGQHSLWVQVSFDFLFLALLLYQLLMVFVFVLNNSLVLTAIVLVSPVPIYLWPI